MLIVSKQLLSMNLRDGAWQAEKRNKESHVLVTDENREQVWDCLKDAAGQLDQDLTSSRHIFEEWVTVTEVEAAAWEEKGVPNAPIFDPTCWEIRKSKSHSAEVRIYDNALDIVLALLGTSSSMENRRIEVELSELVLDSPKIRSLVINACAKVRKELELRTEDYDRTLSPFLQGEYKDIHGLKEWSTWVKGFSGYTVSTNIAVLHDIYSHLDKLLKNPGPWQGPQLEADRPDFRKRLFKDKNTMRHNVGTVNEDCNWVARARWYNLPVWAGPSGTTHGLCWMLTRLGKVSPAELLACCYALFALWASPHYPKTATPIHHLFGVMTGASEYLPDSYSPTWTPETLYVCVRSFIKLRAKL